MNPEWWEGPVRFLHSFWWLLLILVVLAVFAYFTRNYWLPVLFPGAGA
jgi:hypothetical protein